MSPRSRSFVVPGIIIAAAVVIIAFVLVTGGGGGSDSPGDDVPESLSGVVGEVVEPTAPQSIDAERHDPDDPLAIGALDAPVTIVMFSDFQCPFCALWTAQTLPELMPYIDDGRLRVEWRDLAVFGEDSRRAAYAGYAAGLQGKYYEFTTALFAGGDSPSPSGLSGEALEELAAELDLDVEQFNDDRGSEQVRAAVEKNFAEGEDLGVFSTPAFLVAGQPIIGAQPTDTFIAAVESELENSQ